MNDFNWSQFWVVGIIALLAGGAFTFYFFQKAPTGLNDEEVQAIVDNAVASTIEGKDIEIAELKSTLSNLENVTGTTVGEGGEIIVTEKATVGYLIDELFLEYLLFDELSDREISLFDGEVDFDGSDYDAEESLILNGLELRANDNDFEGDVYLTIPRDSISYQFVIETSLDTSKIGVDDETLTFDFLGNEVEISEWDLDTVTFTQGTEHFMTEGESVTFNDKEIVLEYVLKNAVYVTVDGIGKKIDEGKTGRINIVEIKVDEVLYTGDSTRENKAVIVLGDEVEFEVSDGEEYEDDSIWVWHISENSIGLVLDEEFVELDEEFSARSKNDEICLPNNYVCIIYNGVEEDEEKYTFDIYERDEIEYVRVKGNFLSGINDYDTIYIGNNGTDDGIDGIFERDGSKFLLINATTIELGDTESVLIFDGTDIVIEDFRVDMLLESLEVYNRTEWINKSSEDEDYRTLHGILVNNPEDSVKDNEFTITVPEEKLEGSITVGDGSFEVITSNNETSQ